MKRRAKRKVNIVVLVLIFLIIAVLAIIAKKTFDYLNTQYKMMTHPLQYTSLVEDSAFENNIDKYLVYSVIRTESRFRPNSESVVGARGLMQIMEETFDWLKMRQGDDDDRFSDMYDPQKNIKYGTYYIGYLLRYFDGDRELALCAYHAGPSNVEAWLNNPKYSSDSKKLDIIPMPDTAHYVNKVNMAYDTYIELYTTKETK